MQRNNTVSMGFSRQEYQSRWPFPPPGDLANSGIKPTSPMSPALQANSLLLKPWGKPGDREKTQMLLIIFKISIEY